MKEKLGQSQEDLAGTDSGGHSWGVGNNPSRPAIQLPSQPASYPTAALANTHYFFGGIIAHNTYLSSNTGIGATAPAAKLHILSSGSGTGFTLRTQDTAGIDKLVVLDNGNVGVGTTNPAYKMQVAGSFDATAITVNGSPLTADAAFNLLTSGTNTSATMTVGAGSALDYVSTGAINAKTLVGSTWLAPGIIGGTTATSGSFTALASTQGANLATATGNIGLGTASPIALLQAGSGPTSSLVMTSVGNVGIGTTAPAVGLEVASATSDDSRSIIVSNRTTDWLAMRAGNSTPWFGFKGDRLSFVNESSKTNSWTTELMVLKSSGNVGIGTTTPTSKLQVSGDGIFSGNITSDESWSISNVAKIARYQGDDATYNDIGFFNPLASVRMTILDGGNVGIGTTGPTVKLSVVGGRIAQDTWTADGDTAVQYDTVTNALGIATSDRRLKKDFQPLEGALEKVLRLNGLLYRDNDQPDTDKKKLGLIAQDVLEVCPEAVFEYKDEKGETYYGVHYERLTVVLIEAIKQQQLEIEGLKQAVNRLKGKL